MKRTSIYCLLFSFFGVFAVFGQNEEIKLGLCQDLPLDFYANDYTSIQIQNDLGYCISPIKVLDHRIANFIKLEELDYINNLSEEDEDKVILPSEISQLKKLRKIKTNVPNDELFGMSQLTNLSLIVNDTTVLSLLVSEGLEYLPNLESLDLYFALNLPNNFSISGISELEHLKTIHLFNPSQDVMDAVLANATITTLSVRYSENVTLDFSQLTQLEKLELDNNGIRIIPPSVYACSKLKELKFVSNSIQEIGDKIGQLSQLERLEMIQCDLTSISPELTRCAALKTLNLRDNRHLTELPLALGNLELLEILDVNGCQLTSLPRTLEKCHYLRTLKAKGNKLEQLDIRFHDMKQLKEVLLGNNELQFVDSSLFSLATIRELDLSQNELTHLSHSIGGMKNLEQLEIHTNKLNALPEDIGRLTHLERLSAYQKNIGSLPTSLTSLENLSYLYIGDNNIRALPENLDELKSLQALEIQNNPLTLFPIQIYEMKRLDRVWVSPEQHLLLGFVESQEDPMIITTR